MGALFPSKTKLKKFRVTTQCICIKEYIFEAKSITDVEENFHVYDPDAEHISVTDENIEHIELIK